MIIHMKLYRIVYAIFIQVDMVTNGLKSTWEIDIYNACGGITVCYIQQFA